MKATLAQKLGFAHRQFAALQARFDRYVRRQEGSQTPADELADEAELDPESFDTTALAEAQAMFKAIAEHFEFEKKYEAQFRLLSLLLVTAEREAQRGRRLEGPEYDKARSELETQPEAREVLDAFPGAEIGSIRQRVSA